jgi:hypothetical protein
MAYKFVSLAVVALALSIGPNSITSAQPAGQAAELEIVVNGTPQRRYAHDGRWYIEALKGREYAVRVRNPYPVRVGVALSVDGLNTIDARHTDAADARKWVIEPYQTITISGWQTSRTDARRFEFTTEADSYGQALGKTTNLGVISAVFFKERVSTIIRNYSNDASARHAPAAEPAAPTAGQGVGDIASTQREAAKEEYAATGMGRRTDHAVSEVWLDLENAPAQTVNIRYEYRSQLVRLGILPEPRISDPLQRREGARGFEPGFSPEPRGR